MKSIFRSFPTGQAILVGLCLGCIQIGGPSVLSGATVALLLLLVIFRPFNPQFPLQDAVLGALVLLLPVIPFIADPDFLAVLARQIRMMMCLWIILLGSRCSVSIDRVKVEQLRNSLIAFQVLVLVACLVQLVGLRYGWAHKVFIPYDWFGVTAGGEDEARRTTVPSYWLEFMNEKGLVYGSDLNLRPTAFYTEPSYMCTVMFCVSVVVSGLGRNSSDMKLYISLFCGFVVALTSQSVSGILLLVVYFGGMSIVRFGLKWWHVPLSFAFLVALWVSGSLERLLSIGDLSGDISGYIRLVKPFENISQVFGDGYIFGHPAALATTYFSEYVGFEYVGYGLDNGVLNAVMDLGFGAVVLFYIICRCFSWEIALVYFLLILINGNYLGFDRAFLMLGVCLLLSSKSTVSASRP